MMDEMAAAEEGGSSNGMAATSEYVEDDNDYGYGICSRRSRRRTDLS